MNTLAIKDLARSEHLDRPTMAAVRGGWRVNASSPALQDPGRPATANGSAFAGAQVDNDATRRGASGIVRR